MELKQAIYNRRSVRAFADKPVERAIIEQLVDAGQQAPSACNKQGWRFVAVDNQLIKEQVVKKAGANYLITKAPWTVFVFYQKHLTENKQSYTQSASAAIQNMLLTAHSLGLGCCWLTGIGDTDIIKQILKAPDDYYLIAVVALGYPLEEPQAPSRKKISDILSFDYFNFADDSGYPFSYNPKDWALKQISQFRANSVRAASPLQNPFNFGRIKENKAEIAFASKYLSTSQKVLEILPFAGAHTVGLLKAKPISQYHIFELSGENSGFVEKRLLANGLKIKISSQVSPDLVLPYPDNYFEAIVIFQKLEGLPEPSLLFSEIIRVLKPGGKLILSFKNKWFFFGFYYWLKTANFKKKPIWNYGPFKPLGYWQVKKMLQKSFVIKKVQGISPLILIGKTIGQPLSFLGRLVIVYAIKP